MVDGPKLSLKGARILIIEDNALSAMLAEEMLAELGCTVAGTANSVEAALAAIDRKGPFDCVMLDVRLGHEISSDIATYLIKKDLPFIICSGYDIKLPGMNIPVVDKPYTAEALGYALTNAIASRSQIRT
jgi:CheY-like chemotaxis protein